MISKNSSSLGRIDQYNLLRELGGGGFGCVYLARDTVSQIDVAVKGLPPLVRNNQSELENIRKNFALVSRLHHPNIAAALTLHPAKEVVYHNSADADKLRVFKGDTLVVMQYAPGLTLTKWSKQFSGGIVPLEKALEITSCIAHALDYAHAEKILHRDIKPENVIIDVDKNSRMTVRVLDFGLAAEIHSSMSRVSNDISDTSGTRPYMAPEQWLGADQGPQTDQYSLAVLFHELVTGKVPLASVFETGDPLVMFGAVSRKEIEIPSWLPKPVRQALSKALSKKRKDRFSSCMEFAEALRHGVKSKFITSVTALCTTACFLAVAGAVAYRFVTERIEPPAAEYNEEIKKRITVKEDAKQSASLVASVSVPVTTPSSEPTLVSNSVPASVSSHTSAPLPKHDSAPVRGSTSTPTASAKLISSSVRASEVIDNSAKKPDAVLQKKPQLPIVEAPKLPPELKIVAEYEGREIRGAKIKTMNGVYELPYKWEGNLSGRRQLGPYEVTYERGEEYLTGEFKVESIDWSGLKVLKVEMKRSDKKAKGGIGVWAF